MDVVIKINQSPQEVLLVGGSAHGSRTCGHQGNRFGNPRVSAVTRSQQALACLLQLEVQTPAQDHMVRPHPPAACPVWQRSPADTQPFTQWIREEGAIQAKPQTYSTFDCKPASAHTLAAPSKPTRRPGARINVQSPHGPRHSARACWPPVKSLVAKQIQLGCH